ncbi:MAG TPA: (2Fe-2S) ferredoxin domain-containing protein [Pyrinomonadaceae bacterium]|nr:(2Fe-2S) ferredoxin domain-containing protein [Pyrinomonadaceae bacterium]
MPGLKKIKKHVLVCDHKDCARGGGKEALRELKSALRESGLRDEVLITKVDCFDQCEHAPVMVVYPEGVWYGEVDERGAREIAERHIRGGGAAARCEVLRDMRAGGEG